VSIIFDPLFIWSEVLRSLGESVSIILEVGAVFLGFFWKIVSIRRVSLYPRSIVLLGTCVNRSCAESASMILDVGTVVLEKAGALFYWSRCSLLVIPQLD
jgi:hypothetical protein